MAKVRVLDFECGRDEVEDGAVIEVGFCDVDTETKNISPARSWLCRTDSISVETRAVHHITMKMINDDSHILPFNADALNKDAEAHRIDCWAAHGADYELKFFKPNKPMICCYKSALRAWPEAPSHSNAGIRYWLEDKGLVKPDHNLCLPHHRAGPDSYVTAWTLVALLNAGYTGRDMTLWSKEPALLPRCPLGKYRNQPWSEVDDGFLGWICSKLDIAEDIRWNANRELERRVA